MYEFDACPFCKKVREMVSYLDLDCIYKPCPQGGPTYRPEATEKSGKSMFPYMEDPNAGKAMLESDDIIQYLADTYGNGEVPLQLRLGAATAITAGLSGLGRCAACPRLLLQQPPLPSLQARASALPHPPRNPPCLLCRNSHHSGRHRCACAAFHRLSSSTVEADCVRPPARASLLSPCDSRRSASASAAWCRFGKGGKYRAAKKPAEPLVVWGYEPSPFVRLVRETLTELELPHLFKTCARGSPKRQELFDKHGQFVVPYLEDPNTGVAMFESAAIVKYLEGEYALADVATSA